MPLLSLAAYWIGQANDLSAGTHPTGYSAGQRWSATAAQWQSMYNAEVTLYNNEVAAYNDMVSQRDIWISRANSAWGASRVWSSGESWEAAYNRVLPPDINTIHISASGSASAPGAVCSLNVNRTGYWTVVFRGSVHQDGNAAPGSATLSPGDVITWDAGGDQSMDCGVGMYAFGLYNSGQLFAVSLGGASGNSINGTLHAYFNSSIQNPH